MKARPDAAAATSRLRLVMCVVCLLAWIAGCGEDGADASPVFTTDQLPELAAQPQDAPSGMQHDDAQSGPAPVDLLSQGVSGATESFEELGFLGGHAAIFVPTDSSEQGQAVIANGVFIFEDAASASSALEIDAEVIPQVMAGHQEVAVDSVGEETYAFTFQSGPAGGPGAIYGFRIGNAVFLVPGSGESIDPDVLHELAETVAAQPRTRADALNRVGGGVVRRRPRRWPMVPAVGSAVTDVPVPQLIEASDLDGLVAAIGRMVAAGDWEVSTTSWCAATRRWSAASRCGVPVCTPNTGWRSMPPPTGRRPCSTSAPAGSPRTTVGGGGVDAHLGGAEPAHHLAHHRLVGGAGACAPRRADPRAGGRPQGRGALTAAVGAGVSAGDVSGRRGRRPRPDLGGMDWVELDGLGDVVGDRDTCDALLDVVRPWLDESSGRGEAVAVAGDARQAIRALGPHRVRLVDVDLGTGDAADDVGRGERGRLRSATWDPGGEGGGVVGVGNVLGFKGEWPVEADRLGEEASGFAVRHGSRRSVGGGPSTWPSRIPERASAGWSAPSMHPDRPTPPIRVLCSGRKGATTAPPRPTPWLRSP